MNYFDTLKFEGVFERVAHVFGKRALAFMAISALVYVLGWIFTAITSMMLGYGVRVGGFSVNLGVIRSLDSPHKVVIYLLEGVVYYCFVCLAHGAAVWLVIHLYLQQHRTIQHAFQKGFEKLAHLITATLIVTVSLLAILVPASYVMGRTNDDALITVIMMVLVMIMIFVAIVTFLVYAVIMTEDVGAVRAIRRSFDLSFPRFWFMFCIALTCFVIKFIIGLLLMSMAFSAYPFTENKFLYYTCMSLDTVLGILYAALSPIFQGVLYITFRVEAEELNFEKLASEIGIEGDDYITMNNMEDGVGKPATTEAPTAAVVATEDATKVSPMLEKQDGVVA
mmetsp:Transcript_3853/g.10223  ORF Transcript_3853/g.10223 Transcript_3853/m.10223 type:complete len:337 (-) Transcript_3853:915-1925(-)